MEKRARDRTNQLASPAASAPTVALRFTLSAPAFLYASAPFAASVRRQHKPPPRCRLALLADLLLDVRRSNDADAEVQGDEQVATEEPDNDVLEDGD